MEKNDLHKEKVWELKSRVEEQTFTHFDFTKTNFNSAVFFNVNFINCLFEKSILTNSKIFYDSNFESCTFKHVDLSHSTFGSHKGTYKDCIFENCNFKGKEFNFSRFINCEFVKSKLVKINFNASSFLNCKFVGKLADVTFNGIYDTDKSDCQTLNSVDFSKAQFGEFVTFVNCDLSSCIPPFETKFNEILYPIYIDNHNILSTGTPDRIVLS